MEKTVNERVEMLRTYLKLSQADFAQECGLTQTGIWRIESNEVKPRKTTLHTIASTFKVSSDWLINGIGEMTFEKKEVTSKEINPWKDALVQQLQTEVTFLRSIVSNMSQNKSGSFLNGIAPVGLFRNEKMSNIVRV